ncbi:MAG: acyl-CoA thioesterase [Agarilytica sp.]
MRTATIEIEIPFHDVDSMNIVWHGHYAKYFEIARCALLESFDYGYQEMRNSGYSWPIVDMRTKYISPLSFRQKVLVKASLIEWECRIKIAYTISDRCSEKTLCRAHTTQMAINLKNGETCMQSPNCLLDKLEPIS